MSEKSLTWIKLDEKQWLLICIDFTIPLSIAQEKELMHKYGINFQSEGPIISTSSYTWRSYRFWKSNNGTLTCQDKVIVELMIMEAHKNDN